MLQPTTQPAVLPSRSPWSLQSRFSRLPRAGMALGLLLAAIAIFRPLARPLTSVPPGYVALVNQQGILTSDFISQTATETEEPFTQTTAEQRAHVLHEMIDRELLVQRALALDLPETTVEVRSELADAVSAQAAAPALAQQPTDAELRAYYDTHRGRYTAQGTMTVRDLVLPVNGLGAQANAAEAVYQLRSGASVESVMAQYGFEDASPQYGVRQTDVAARTRLGDKLYQAASMLSTGEVSAPILEGAGVHVLIMQQRQAPSVEDFPSARVRVYADFRREESELAANENLQFLRSQAQILLAPGLSE